MRSFGFFALFDIDATLVVFFEHVLRLRQVALGNPTVFAGGKTFPSNQVVGLSPFLLVV
jgi:hypothetical protein